MFLEERHGEILELLKRDHKVKVQELSDHFVVSADCIRKDLAVMEQQGLLKRTYGGAILPRTEQAISNLERYRKEQIMDKRNIANIVREMVMSKDLVFIGISACSIALADILVNTEKRLTVATDMLEVMSTLSNNPRIRVLGVGGDLNQARDGFVGAQAVDTIRSMRPSLAFIGANGIDAYSNSVYTDDPEDRIQKRAIIAAAERTYIMMESEKFNFVGKYSYTELDSIRGIITDTAPSEEVCNLLAEHEVDLLVPAKKKEDSAE